MRKFFIKVIIVFFAAYFGTPLIAVRVLPLWASGDEVCDPDTGGGCGSDNAQESGDSNDDGGDSDGAKNSHDKSMSKEARNFGNGSVSGSVGNRTYEFFHQENGKVIQGTPGFREIGPGVWHTREWREVSNSTAGKVDLSGQHGSGVSSGSGTTSNDEGHSSSGLNSGRGPYRDAVNFNEALSLNLNKIDRPTLGFSLVSFKLQPLFLEPAELENLDLTISNEVLITLNSRSLVIGETNLEVEQTDPGAPSCDATLTEEQLADLAGDVEAEAAATGFSDDDFRELVAGIAIGLTPGVNDAADLTELITGKDLASCLNGICKDLGISDRLVSGLGLILGSGQLYRKAMELASAEKSLEQGTRGVARNLSKSRAASALSELPKELHEVANRTFGLRVKMPYGSGYAEQEITKEALQARLKIESGSRRVYRRGDYVKAKIAVAGEGPYTWAPDNKNLQTTAEEFAEMFGTNPIDTFANSFVEVAEMKAGAKFVTRKAPGFNGQPGGAIEVVVDPSDISVIVHTFKPGVLK